MVKVGIDCIMGQTSFFLSHLLVELRMNYVMYLFQAMIGRDFHIIIGNWVKILVWLGSLQRSGRHIRKNYIVRGYSDKTKMMSLYGWEVTAQVTSQQKNYTSLLQKNYGPLLLDIGEVIFGNGIWYQRLNSLSGYLWRT